MKPWYNNDRLLVDEELVHRQLPANIDLLSEYWKILFSKIVIQKEPAIHLIEGEDVAIDVDGAIWTSTNGPHLDHHEYSESRVVRQRLNLRPTPQEWIDHPGISAGALYRSIKQMAKNVNFENLPSSSNALYFSDNRAQSNFYHWFVDSVVRLLLAEPWVRDSFLLVAENQLKSKYVTEILEKIGFPSERLIPIKRGVRYKASSLQVVTCSIFATGACSSKGMSILRERLIVPDQLGYAIYLARKPSQGRRIVNEIEFMNVLKKYGVQLIYAEDVPFEKLVELLGKAILVMGVYGAALTHMIFLPSNSHIIELAPTKFIGPTPSYWGDNYHSKYAGDYYYSLAEACGLNYHLIPCDQQDEDGYLLSSDIVVNLDLLTKTLSLLA